MKVLQRWGTTEVSNLLLFLEAHFTVQPKNCLYFQFCLSLIFFGQFCIRFQNFSTVWLFSDHRPSCLVLQSQPTNFTSLIVVWPTQMIFCHCLGPHQWAQTKMILQGNRISLKPFGNRKPVTTPIFKLQHCLCSTSHKQGSPRLRSGLNYLPKLSLNY